VPLANLSELALVFAEPSQRPAIRAALDLIAALDLALPQQGTEEAQLTRLAWWEAEIQRFVAGSPQHPAARELLVHGLSLLQAPHWHRLIRAQAQRIAHPHPDPQALGDIASEMGAGFAAMAVLLGHTAQLATYQRLGADVWLVNELVASTEYLQHGGLMTVAEQGLVACADQLSAREPAADHRFAIVLASLYARTAARERHRRGAGAPAPLSRLWIAWRAALRGR